MVIDKGNEARALKTEVLARDLVIVGGGISGVCAAITAARQGLQVALVQDRPVLGGNASSEVRLWMLGATSHMGNNNRWSREGGVIDEILVENVYRNPEGNPVILDMILLDKVVQETNITLLLNTVVYQVEKTDPDTIKSVTAFCSQNSTEYNIAAPLFCDASGDGIVGFLAGAAFRMGAESKEEFDELMAPDASYGELLGHSLYFYSKDSHKPVKFIPPSFAKDVTREIPRFKNFNADEQGCKLWWIEHGGRLDTVHDTEAIKWDLWKVVYGVWDYIKNSGKFPEAETLTLEWVGMIPGKRESRRFEGDYMLSQKDLIEQRSHGDDIAYGGWAIDLHPADGVFSKEDPCNQWHSKGIFPIPYRSLYSRNIKNLFLAGRLISVSHVAYGATRVMATCAYVSQAVAMAAYLCNKYNTTPKDLLATHYMAELQNELMRAGQYIPGLALKDPRDLVQKAALSASSALAFSGFSVGCSPEELLWKELQTSAAQLFAFPRGAFPVFSIAVKAKQKTTLVVELRCSAKIGDYTPDVVLGQKEIVLEAGYQELDLNFDCFNDEQQYVFLCFIKNADIELSYTKQRITGLLSVFNGVNKAVSNKGRQVPPAGTGAEQFEFWCPERRPAGYNLAIGLSKPIELFDVENIRNGVDRPTLQPNAWVASPEDGAPHIFINWPQVERVSRIELSFDTDFDHAMESVLMTHPERVMPFCVQKYRLEDGEGHIIYETSENFRTRNVIELETAVQINELRLFLDHPSPEIPAALFSLRCYG